MEGRRLVPPPAGRGLPDLHQGPEGPAPGSASLDSQDRAGQAGEAVPGLGAGETHRAGLLPKLRRSGDF